MANRPLRKEPEKAIQFHCSIPHGKRPASGAHTAVAACGTDADVISPDLLQDLSNGKSCEHGMELLMSLDAEDDLEVLMLIAVVEEAVVTDLLETDREHIHHEPPYELLWSNTDCLRKCLL